jgi:circadian clock protein KaiC
MNSKKTKEKNNNSRKSKEKNFDDYGKRFRTGIKGLDNLFHKGIPNGSAVLVEGGPGSGKTNICLQICKNKCLEGKKVLFMSFEEKEERLRAHMKAFGWDPTESEKKGFLYLKRFNALDIARSVEALLSEAKRELLIDIQPVLIPKEFKPDIIFIDSLSSIASAFSGEESRFRIYMEQLFRYLESNNITSFLIREVSNPSHTGNTFKEQGEAVSFLSDGIIIIYNVFYPESGKRERAIEILKMRGDDIDRRIVKLEMINKKGVIVDSTKQIKGKYKLT